MGLTEYKKKRSFNKTPEPQGKKKSSREALHFVVQKHAASRLHYDFRLEMEGVLKSWAVPKGPSLNPEDKRLAMMVEDHPYDYKDFEGIIPPGNYGAGTVIVWDQGTFEPYVPVEGNKKDQEKELLRELKKGDLKFVLNGEKLKGAYALVHIKGKEDNAWLLIKKKDKFARKADITKKDKSVVSGMKLEKVAKESTNEWQSNRQSRTGTQKKSSKSAKSSNPSKSALKKSSKSTKSSSAKSLNPSKSALKKTSQSRTNSPSVKSSNPPKSVIKKNSAPDLTHKGSPSKIPRGITPMLATLTDQPFDNDDWVFEIKWDGYRALAFIEKGKVELLSRKNLSFNKKFYPVAEALQDIDANVVLDGEIIAVNDEGKGDFQRLQQWQKTGKGHLIYYVFDMLWINGRDITGLPLIERKELLQKILPDSDIIRYSDHIAAKGTAFYREAAREGLEGIMAKKADGTYTPEVRTKQWLKVKAHRQQEAVICGFTEPRRSRKYFGALVLGVYKKGELTYAGHTGTGFTEKL
jgi:bifunctional non-homologous end joining protein LigD